MKKAELKCVCICGLKRHLKRQPYLINRFTQLQFGEPVLKAVRALKNLRRDK